MLDLHTLIASVPTAANAGHYARIVRERAILRLVVEAGPGSSSSATRATPTPTTSWTCAQAEDTRSPTAGPARTITRRPEIMPVSAGRDRGHWIDQVALGPDGAVAWSAGKTAHVVTKKGEDRTHEAPSTVAGLAFAPKGFRVAIAHYNGVTLWFPNAAAKPETLEWKGSHLSAAFSPDGKFLVTAMQEPTLHGWRLADAKHMRMSGYSARVRSLSWTADGDFLATSGSEQLILWPFDGKDGPMGRQPKLQAPSEARVAVVACHPRQPVVAVGYADGAVVLVRTDDGALIRVKAEGGSPVSALGWAASGQTLAFGTEAGQAGALSF